MLQHGTEERHCGVMSCRSDNSWRSIVDVLFCAAMGPPGGGRNNVTPRYLRHVNLVAISEFDDDTYQQIYTVCAAECLPAVSLHARKPPADSWDMLI